MKRRIRGRCRRRRRHRPARLQPSHEVLVSQSARRAKPAPTAPRTNRRRLRLSHEPAGISTNPNVLPEPRLLLTHRSDTKSETRARPADCCLSS